MRAIDVSLWKSERSGPWIRGFVEIATSTTWLASAPCAGINAASTIHERSPRMRLTFAKDTPSRLGEEEGQRWSLPLRPVLPAGGGQNPRPAAAAAQGIRGDMPYRIWLAIAIVATLNGCKSGNTDRRDDTALNTRRAQPAQAQPAQAQPGAQDQDAATNEKLMEQRLLDARAAYVHRQYSEAIRIMEQIRTRWRYQPQPVRV